MKYSVRLASKAETDVESILQRVSEQKSTPASHAWFRQLVSVLATLESNPERCPMATESDDIGIPIRELLFGKRQYKYRLLFIVSGRTVSILRISRGARSAVTLQDI